MQRLPHITMHQAMNGPLRAAPKTFEASQFIEDTFWEPSVRVGWIAKVQTTKIGHHADEAYPNQDVSERANDGFVARPSEGRFHLTPFC